MAVVVRIKGHFLSECFDVWKELEVRLILDTFSSQFSYLLS
jgi:hypothetical protein